MHFGNYFFGYILLLVRFDRISGDKTIAMQSPTVAIALILRNCDDRVSYLLQSIERLAYPKDRMMLLIFTDNNVDKTATVIDQWADGVKDVYREVLVVKNEKATKSKNYPDEDELIQHDMNLLETALMIARQKWADNFLLLDAKTLLLYSRSLQVLQESNKVLIAPMLSPTDWRESNFETAVMDSAKSSDPEQHYYKILKRIKIGNFVVNKLQPPILIDLRESETQELSFNSTSGRRGGLPPIITTIDLLIESAKKAKIDLIINNQQNYGYLFTEKTDKFANDDEITQFIATLSIRDGVDKSPYQIPEEETKTKLGLDAIYLINLDRRTERREFMSTWLNIYGIEYKRMSAVDGSSFQNSEIIDLKISPIPNFKDQYGGSITNGHVGNVFSHHDVFEDILRHKFQSALILEDDVMPLAGFPRKVMALYQEANKMDPKWDIICLIRNQVEDLHHKEIDNAEYIAEVGNSVSMQGYLISLSGVMKLINGGHYSNIMPIEEYVSVLANKHRNGEWGLYFPKKNLRIYASKEFLLDHRYYLEDPEYYTDITGYGESEYLETVPTHEQHDEL